MLWIKNTKGKPDAMLTFAIISFTVITLNILLSTFGTIMFNGNTITFQALDGTIMAVYLGATFTAYVSRRWTDIRYKSNPSPTPVIVEPAEPESDQVIPIEIPVEKLTEITKPRPDLIIKPDAPVIADEEDTEEIRI